ncbi:DUF6335 family protein [Gloeocapsopsis sp. IPPAS B-1203]|uniref:DUF6335 family protein n=1 Tax=Gloeocapsopsis sp. IPPAS B-1203 TaxID=2049454 RepID=UPI000C175C33|nr:DUF6335 family protein [Gloeocapsopsis sp. IPPAS B-1203]PIG93161.1 hypothetical protein CSQ79_13230 [Gloeocapsopsis sp. IPPAS B-1203]
MAEKINKADKDTHEFIDEVEQESTASYGTGVHTPPGVNSGRKTVRDRLNDYNDVSPELSGGDLDAAWDQADVAGEEAVGGTAPTPDQNVVDEIGSAVGLDMAEEEYVHTTEVLNVRDDRRWELDPQSSEDYQEHSD